MLNQASKVLLALSAISVAAMVVYAMLSGDHLGIALFASLAAAAIGGAITYASMRDTVAVPASATEGEPPRMHPVMPARPVGGGIWPALAALAAGLVFTSLAGSIILAFAGATVGVVALVGWLAAVGTERTARRPVNLLPFGIPVLGFAFIASLMYLMSRILLAVSEITATWVALGVAAVILFFGSYFALRPNLSARTMMSVLAIGAVLMTGGGLVAAAVGEREIEHHGAEEHAGGETEGVEISANNIAFDHEELDLHAGQDVTIVFHNNEGLPHNVSIYADEDAREKIFVGDIVTGPTTVEYHVKALEAGTYFFRCDVHPNMRGTVKVA